MSATTAEAPPEAPAPRPRRRLRFPSAITTLAIVMVAVWVAALFVPSGTYQLDADGGPIPGTYTQVPSPLTGAERVEQLLLSPVNGLYGLINGDGVVDTETVGHLFGSIGVVMFIMALGAFISVAFSTRSLEVGVSRLADRLRDRGWLLVAAIMVLFSLLGSTMGFSVETFGFYPLLIPLFLALGYDRMVAATAILLGALTGSMASTVNPFSIGVASGEAGVSIGDGIALRVLLWVVLTTMAVLFVLRYARRVRRDPGTSLVGFDQPADEDEADEHEAIPPGTRLTRTQTWVLVVTVLTFALMIFSVIPWSSIFGSTGGPADDGLTHQTATAPYWFELGWWFPELTMLFVVAAIVVGLVARMGEGKLVGLIARGAADMIGPAIVILLARGVSVIMTNTDTLDTVLHAMENAVTGAAAAAFTALVTIVNIPLAFLIPSSSGHATLAMPLLAPLGDFAGVSRSLVITAFQMGHGLMLLFAPTNAVLVGGLAIAKVGYDKYLRFVWPLLAANLVVAIVVVGIAAATG
ncbi:YfcC family protein [Cellulomonas alba]|uniref:YfcC family protein n=1 Tax=Cellulomonas alba TaxID=3053467 RepID=A0ABT7SD93_9CELL|nr:YfcC family protein [Cellulomonas alba]MDM7854155.1 YfcC family protein [Cellulomonas alba]